MVLVERVIKIVFLVQTNATVTQIRNYLVNTIFPGWRTSLDTAFTGYVSGSPTVHRENQNYITTIAGFTDPERYQVYPKFGLRLEVPSGTESDAQSRYHTFIEDAREWTRQQLIALTGTQVLAIFWRKADGTEGSVTF